ncbi:MAG: glycine cleavage system aminomethyltransferase GcvT [Hyphomicrobium sp.]
MTAAKTPTTNSTLNITPLRMTALHTLHVALGARMVAFAGYDMPVQYADGVLKEHLHTRSAAGLFDVSHMGQVTLRAKSGNIVDAARALERLVPVDVLGIQEGRQRYAFFTNDSGGILDDLMIAHRGDHLLLIVNAACKAADIAHLQQHIGSVCEIEILDRALIALQGPQAEAALAKLAPECRLMRFMDVRAVEILGAPCVIIRSGYTGEDGFEISIPNAAATAIAEALLGDVLVQPVGLGARDTLRLEAGLCLYGSDIDTTTTPVAAGLTWAMQKIRRTGGARQGGFPGAAVILEDLGEGPPRQRVGLKSSGRMPVRHGAQLFATAETVSPAGIVTSGTFSPSLNAPIAMGYLPTVMAVPGHAVFAEVRGARVAMEVCALPFVPHQFKRG